LADDRGGARARAAAAAAVHGVERGTALDAALSEAARGIPANQRSLTAELSYGTCRWYYRLAPVVDRLLERPLRARDRVLHALILVGLYQLLYTRIPAHAALAETVQAARLLGKPKAAGLVNAVLRRFQRESDSLLTEVDRDPAARLAYPEWLYESLTMAWPGQGRAVLEGGNERPPMTLRVNLLRTTRAEIAARLGAAGIASRPVAGVASALQLDSPLPVDEIPGFAQGEVSVQDAAAQLAARLLDAGPGQRVLDACAAPGGKTAHIAEAQPGLAELIAVDVDGARLQRVRENLDRLGLEAGLEVADVSTPQGGWADGGYDRILLDAPCSATGVIRRHPDIKLLRRASDIDRLSERQQRMLEVLWPLLRPGGILLYCTCSVLPAENALRVEAFLETHPDARAHPLALPFGRPSGTGWQILPGDAATDGFFYARLEKQP